MSDSEDSMVTYTVVFSPFGGLSDIGSPGVDGPPVMPEDPYAYMVAAFQVPPSPDYVPGLEEPEEAPLLSEFVPEPVYQEFMPPEDEILPAEEQPLHAADSPTADSLGYIPESDPKDDPKEYDDEDPEEDPLIILSMEMTRTTVEHAPSAEETEPFKTDECAATPPPHPIYCVTASITEVTLPPQKRLCIALGLRYEVGESSSAAASRLTGDTWDEMLEDIPGAPTIDDTELGRQMTEFVTRVGQDTDEMYTRLDEAQDDRMLMSGQLNMLYRDRRDHALTVRLIEAEARLSREAWI
ncbi:hypothetical protein Tco_1410980 [Tanacetum coccineum]